MFVVWVPVKVIQMKTYGKRYFVTSVRINGDTSNSEVTNEVQII